jgi:flagellar hook-associated protein 3 FlgL
MRITEQMSTAATLNGLQSTYSNLSSLQAQLSSGRQITKPSDNPSGTVTALELRSQVAQSTQFQTNANAATSWLSQVDSTMQSVNKELQSARSLVVQGLNSGTADTGSNAALASDIDGIKASLLNLANSTQLGRPVFGGTTAGAQAFALTPVSPATTPPTTAVTYAGNTGSIVKDVGPATSVQVNQLGTDVFGADGSNVFDALTAISKALKAGTLSSSSAIPVTSATASSATTDPLAALDSALSLSETAQATEGSASDQVQAAQGNVTNNVLQYQTQLSTLQDVDVANMAISVQSANTAYDAALATTAKISQTSLLSYLQ